MHHFQDIAHFKKLKRSRDHDHAYFRDIYPWV